MLLRVSLLLRGFLALFRGYKVLLETYSVSTWEWTAQENRNKKMNGGVKK